MAFVQQTRSHRQSLKLPTFGERQPTSSVALPIHWMILSMEFSEVIISSYTHNNFKSYKITIKFPSHTGNKKHPSSPSPQFSEEDPRLVNVVPLDPRIHFALNCGAKSCPAIRIYSEANLENGLESATRTFLSDTVIVSGTGKIVLSKILLWYASDFGSCTEDIVRYNKEQIWDTHCLNVASICFQNNAWPLLFAVG